MMKAKVARQHSLLFQLSFSWPLNHWETVIQTTEGIIFNELLGLVKNILYSSCGQPDDQGHKKY